MIDYVNGDILFDDEEMLILLGFHIVMQLLIIKKTPKKPNDK